MAVVGAGISGISAARFLAQRGHSVTLFEQNGLGNSQGSSHGKSRIIRRTYSDPFYTDCMVEAYPLWIELERLSGAKLIHEVGLLYFGEPTAKNLIDAEAGLRSFSVSYEKVDRQSVHRVFPDLHLNKSEIGLFTPEAGWIDAENALQSSFRLAVADGMHWEEKRATKDDLRCFDRTIITAGAWIRQWWPQAAVKVTLQTYATVGAETNGPVWIEETDDLLYGFPSERGTVKIGVHRAGPEIDPDSPSREPDVTALEKIAAFAKHRLSMGEGPFRSAHGCLYTTTRNEDFLVSHLDDKTTVASACSGHGFKFGPWFGRLLADLVEDRSRIGRFSRFLV